MEIGSALQVLILAALYGFLATLLYYLWRDERRAARGASVAPPARLIVLDEAAPRSFVLSSSTLLGRAADNTISLEDPLISAHHARLSYAGGQWLLEDLGSRNGTRVNDTLVESPMALATGDVLRLGNRSLRFAAGLGPEDPGGEAAAPVAD